MQNCDWGIAYWIESKLRIKGINAKRYEYTRGNKCR